MWFPNWLPQGQWNGLQLFCKTSWGNEASGAFRLRMMLWACGILGKVPRVVCDLWSGNVWVPSGSSLGYFQLQDLPKCKRGEMLLPLLCTWNTTAELFGGLELHSFPDTVVWTLPGGSQPLRGLNLSSKWNGLESEFRASPTGCNGRLQVLFKWQR